MSYLTTVLADNPVHYWRCADGGGDVLFDIGSSPTPAVLNFTAIALPFAGPNSDGGALCAVDNLAAIYRDTEGLVSGAYTLEGWVWQIFNNAQAQDFLSITNGTATVSIGLDASSHPHVFASAGTIAAAAVASKHHWHHIVYTETGTLSTLYVDAIAQPTIAGTALSNLGTAVLGAGGTPAAPARFLLGFVSELAVYSTALSASHVTNHFVAADATTNTPVYLGGGSFSQSTQTLITQLGDLSTILAAVRKTFPTT